MKKLVAFAVVLSIVSLFIQSCKKDSPESAMAYSKLQLYLTDSTGPYDEVNVEILQVEIHSTSAGWQTKPLLHPGIYNLLDYTNGLDTLILNDSLPAGTISQIRLILGSNNSIKVGGVVYPLSTPSAEQSGLKLQIHKQLLPGITYAITLDFDAAKSIVKTGNGKYKLKPVIRTFTEGIDGAIRGKVVPGLIMPVYAILGTDTTGGFTNSSGEFFIQGLVPGSYTVLITPPAPYSNDTIYNVGVTAGHITDMGNINL